MNISIPPVGLIFAIPQERGPFGRKRPSKWAKVVAVRDYEYIVAVRRSTLERHGEESLDEGKKENAEMMTLSTEDFQSLLSRVKYGGPKPRIDAIHWTVLSVDRLAAGARRRSPSHEEQRRPGRPRRIKEPMS